MPPVVAVCTAWRELCLDLESWTPARPGPGLHNPAHHHSEATSPFCCRPPVAAARRPRGCPAGTSHPPRPVTSPHSGSQLLPPLAPAAAVTGEPGPVAERKCGVPAQNGSPRGKGRGGQCRGPRAQQQGTHRAEPIARQKLPQRSGENG
jgi:hypothetical protein